MVTSCGRHAYYRVANNDVIAALEALSVIAPYRPPVSLRTLRQLAALSGARTCYDHVAGRLGVELAESLQDSGLVQRGIAGFEVDAGGGTAVRRSVCSVSRCARANDRWSARALTGVSVGSTWRGGSRYGQ
jgi:hypothetical protein